MKFSIAFLVLLPVLAMAQVVAPVDPGSAVGLIPVLLNFLSTGQYLAMGAVITLIVCFILNTYILPKLNASSGWTPIIGSLVGALSGVGLAVANGGTLGAASLAVLSGPLATHLWESVVQYFFQKPTA